MKIRVLKACDALFGRLWCCLLTTPGQKSLDAKVGSILLIRPGGIGDAVHLIPAILALRKLFPEAKITVLGERRNAAVYGLCTAVDKVLLYDRPADVIAVVRGTYDVVIDTEQWHRLSAVVARLADAPLLIGYATNERSRLFNHPIAYSQDDYEIDSFFRLLAPLGIGSHVVPDRFLTLPDIATRKAAQLLESLAGKPFVAIFPGASIPERRWGAERFRIVAEMLAARDITAVVVGGKEDKQQGDLITSGALGLNLAGRTSLAETAAVIDRSTLLIGGDSGVLHLAVGLGKPTVSLFGPGRAKKWAPRGGRHIVIDKGLPCSPCTTFGTTPPCPIDAQCMKAIAVDDVFDSVMMLFGVLKP